MKKFMGRERKSSIEERNKQYPESYVRDRDDLVTEDHHLCRFREETSFLQLLEVVR
jgi:hypothetical protein